MNKIERIAIKGIRGAKDEISMDLGKKSILIYGENGTGKSTIADAFEWFYQDKVDYLISEEINAKLAIRNIFLGDHELSRISINFMNKNLDNEKSIGHTVAARNSNSSAAFSAYKERSASENLILRYQDLVRFIIATKSERLSNLQDIIGFNEVKEMRGLLKKMAGKYAKEIKVGDFENRRSQKQAILMDSLGQNVISLDHFIDAINRQVEPLNMGNKLSSLRDIPELLKAFEKDENPLQMDQLVSYNRIADNLSELGTYIDDLQDAYDVYYNVYTKLSKDQQKLQNLQLRNLLTEGLSVLKKDISKDDFCPLCQQEKQKIQLIKELGQRIEESEALRKEFENVREGCQRLTTITQNCTSSIGTILKEKLLVEKDNEALKMSLEEIQSRISQYSRECKKDILSEEMLTERTDLNVDKKDLQSFIDLMKKKATSIAEGRKESTKMQIHGKIIRALDAYNEYVAIKKKQDALLIAKNTFEALYDDFIKRQEDALTTFLDIFSAEINKYYTLINPEEKVESIQLVPLKDKSDEDLQGITIQFSFFDNIHKPPKYLLSESHIHGLGLAFFLASVKAFNKENHFLLLDDVVSSFDAQHRARFIDLLTREFKDYQIILLTHEKDFFDLAAAEVKNKGWLISTLAWSQEKGAELHPYNGAA